MLLGGKIIIADALLNEQKIMMDILRKAGHQVVAVTNDMGHTLRRTRTLYCDLVIVDQNLEGGKGLKTASILGEDHLAAVLLLVDSDVFPQARRFHYLLKPLDYHTLIPAVEAALMYQKRELDLQEQIRELQDKLETQKIVDRAKGKLIDKLGITEAEAHRIIQKSAMNHGLSLKQLAIDILNKEYIDRH